MSFKSIETEEKVGSRANLIQLYRERFGFRLPRERQLWSLCNLQPPTGSELAQFVDSGFILPEQYHGIDIDKEDTIIKQNKKWWPTVDFHRGRWLSVLLECEYFNPGVVFYDSTSVPTYAGLYKDVVNTMRRCPSKTMFCTNVMLQDANPPWKKYSSEIFIEEIMRRLGADRDLWEYTLHIGKYKQNGKKTTMCMYVFVSK